eukprot:3459555-Rhodomonas_salina.1
MASRSTTSPGRWLWKSTLQHQEMKTTQACSPRSSYWEQDPLNAGQSTCTSRPNGMGGCAHTMHYSTLMGSCTKRGYCSRQTTQWHAETGC